MEEWRAAGGGGGEQGRCEKNTMGSAKERESRMERGEEGGGIVMERLGSQFFIASSDLP